jgi:nucleotide-binding universal stress UspA family protein
MRRILIATEGSSCSSEALRRFLDLFEPTRSEVYMLAVVPAVAPGLGAALGPDHYRREADAAQEALDLASVDLLMAGFSATPLVRVGEPAEAIVQVARELSADLVVLGTHGRHGLERVLRGSVAEAVLHRAPCAVFIHPHAAIA